MSEIEKILDKILSLIELLKLEIERMVIGILLIGLSFSVYINISISDEKVSLIKYYTQKNESEKDSLKNVIVKIKNDCNMEKYDLMKDYYIKTNEIVKKVEHKLDKIKKQQSIIKERHEGY